MMHTGISVRAQGARVNNTHAMEATNNHQNSPAINQLSRHRRQLAPILHGEGIVIMDRLNRRRAKQSKSAEVRIKVCHAELPMQGCQGVGDEHLCEEHWCSCEHL
jgi:hypothetical protein